MFDVNIYRLSVQLLPTFLRGKRICALLSVLTGPIGVLAAWLKEYRAAALDKSVITGQVAVLEYILNRQLYCDNGEIYIADGGLKDNYNNIIMNTVDGTYTVNETDKKDYYIPSVLTTEDKDCKFYVYVPQWFTDEQIGQVSAIVDFFKPAGNDYKIKKY